MQIDPNKKIEEYSETELKSLFYDLLVEKQNIENNMKIVNDQIVKLNIEKSMTIK